MNKTAVKRAQSHGYLLNVEGNIEDTFCYKYFDAYSPYHGVYTILCNLVGHEATWDDLTDSNLEIFSKVIKKKYAATSAITYFGYFKTIMFANTSRFTSRKFIDYFEVKAGRKEHVILDDYQLHVIDEYECKTDVDRQTKTLFMRMVLTGARCVDALQFTNDNIVKGDTLFYTSESGHDISVPIYPMLLKYLGNAIPHDIATDKSIHWSMRCKQLFAKMPLPEYIKPDMCLMTALYTFATRLYRKGIDVDSIQDFMGIQTRRHAINMIAGYRKKGTKTVFRKVFDQL